MRGEGRGVKEGGKGGRIRGVRLWARVTGAYTCVCPVVSPLTACGVTRGGRTYRKSKGGAVGNSVLWVA